MKNFTILSFCLLPTLIFAQEDDYCPCMENSNPLINVMNMMSSMEGISAQNFTFERNSPVSEMNFSEAASSNFNNAANQQQKKETKELIAVEKTRAQIESVVVVKKNKVKAFKKTQLVRLKKRKKKCKYKGKCPVF